MRKSAVLLGLGLVGALAGCLSDIPDDCKTDADCGPGARCVDRGVRLCEAVEGSGGGGGSGGEGGLPGAGGTGGDVGVGGTGGAGGEGGSGLPIIDVPAEVVIYADEALAAWLGEYDRDIRTLLLDVEGADVPVHFRYEAGEASIRLVTDGEAGGIPLSTPIPIPEGSETELQLHASAIATRRDGSTDVLALASATVQATGEDDLHVWSLALSHSPDFDWDLDGFADLADCKPDNAGIHPGADDVCDGIDTDCSAACHLELPAGLEAHHLSCGGAGCAISADGIGAAAAEEEGAFLHLDLSLDLQQLAAATEPGAATLNPADSGGATLVGFDRWTRVLSATRLTGGSGRGINPGGSLGPALAISPRGKVGLAMRQSIALAVIFDAQKAAQSGSSLDCTDNPGGGIPIIGDLLGSDPCVLQLLGGLSGPGGNLPDDARALALAARQSGALSDAQFFAIFENDPRLAVITVEHDGEFLAGASGLISLFDEGFQPVVMAANPGASALWVLGQGAEGTQLAHVQTGSNVSGTRVAGTTVVDGDLCPAAMAVHESELLVADACDKKLLRFVLEDGLPSLPPVESPIPYGCVPRSLELLGAGPTALPVLACEGSSKLVVLGAD